MIENINFERLKAYILMKHDVLFWKECPKAKVTNLIHEIDDCCLYREMWDTRDLVEKLQSYIDRRWEK